MLARLRQAFARARLCRSRRSLRGANMRTRSNMLFQIGLAVCGIGSAIAGLIDGILPPWYAALILSILVLLVVGNIRRLARARSANRFANP